MTTTAKPLPTAGAAIRSYDTEAGKLVQTEDRPTSAEARCPATEGARLPVAMRMDGGDTGIFCRAAGNARPGRGVASLDDAEASALGGRQEKAEGGEAVPTAGLVGIARYDWWGGRGHEEAWPPGIGGCADGAGLPLCPSALRAAAASRVRLRRGR